MEHVHVNGKTGQSGRRAGRLSSWDRQSVACVCLSAILHNAARHSGRSHAPPPQLASFEKSRCGCLLVEGGGTISKAVRHTLARLKRTLRIVLGVLDGLTAEVACSVATDDMEMATYYLEQLTRSRT